MRSTLVIIFVLSFYSAHSQYTIFTISEEQNSPNEVSIAVNRMKQSQIVAASNLINVYCSADSGKTWNEYSQKTSLGPYGDPVIHCDDSGVFYHAHLSKTPGKERPDYMDRMIVQRSLDGGLSWSDGVGVGYNQGKMQDKEWLSSDRYNTSPYHGNLYMTWTEFDVYGSKDPKDRSRIRFSRSTDRGLSFSEAITISDTTGDCQDGDHTLEGAVSTTLGDGTILVVWAGHGNIYLDKSTDGGQSFGKDLIIAKQYEGWAHDIPNIFRTNGMPFIAHNEWGSDVFVVYSDKAKEEDYYQLNILFNQHAESEWVNFDISGKDTGSFKGHIFFPNVSVNPHSQQAGIIYYQQNTSADSIQTKLLLITYAPEDGEEVKVLKLGDPFPAPGKSVFFGDYIDLDVFGQGFFCTWTAFENKQLVIKGAKPE